MLDLDYIFHPESIAIVGASANPRNFGLIFLKGLIEASYRGHIYLVNSKGGEALGYKIYRSLGEIPAPVDQVISSIPAPATIDLIKDCVPKKTKVLHLFTSGFSEVGEDGKRLERELAAIGRREGIRIIGPNSLGFYYPRGGLSFSALLPKESGPISLFFQSGGLTLWSVLKGHILGLRFNKVVSYGNAVDINESDLLEYYADDPETEIIGGYIEGVRDGRRFLKALKKASAKKPTVIIKGGRSSAGARTVSSHTGALVGSEVVWDSVFKQTQALRVRDFEEMIDVIMAFYCLPNLSGKRVGIIGVGGGATICAADECEETGLIVPGFPDAVRERLRKFTFFDTDAGSIFCNPIDTPLMLNDPVRVCQIMGIVADCPGIDNLLVYLGSGGARSEISFERIAAMADAIVGFAKSSPKPVVIATQPVHTEKAVENIVKLTNKACASGVPAYTSISRAARAVFKAATLKARRASLSS